MRLLFLLLFSPVVFAEFYIWHDEYGYKNISTHPPECIRVNSNGNKYIDCSALQGDQVQIIAFHEEQKAKEEQQKKNSVTEFDKCKQIRTELNKINSLAKDSQLNTGDIPDELIEQQNRYASLYDTCRDIINPGTARQVDLRYEVIPGTTR